LWVGQHRIVGAGFGGCKNGGLDQKGQSSATGLIHGRRTTDEGNIPRERCRATETRTRRRILCYGVPVIKLKRESGIPKSTCLEEWTAIKKKNGRNMRCWTPTKIKCTRGVKLRTPGMARVITGRKAQSEPNTSGRKTERKSPPIELIVVRANDEKEINHGVEHEFLKRSYQRCRRARNDLKTVTIT